MPEDLLVLDEYDEDYEDYEGDDVVGEGNAVVDEPRALRYSFRAEAVQRALYNSPFPEGLRSGIRPFPGVGVVPPAPFYHPYANHDMEVTTPEPTYDVLGSPDREPAAPNVEVVYYDRQTPGYSQHLRSAFQFFRRNAGNKYSSATLMRLANAADLLENEHAAMPVVTVATSPTSFDEETEVKTGGTSGMMVTFPDGRALFAVQATARRKGIGRLIFFTNQNWTYVTPYFWVHNSNQSAQQFLLAMGLSPTALNGSGAVRYGYTGLGDE